MNMLQVLRIFSIKPFRGKYRNLFNQSLRFRLMRNHDILDLRRICGLQVRELWRNSSFAGPNMKACCMIYSVMPAELDEQIICIFDLLGSSQICKIVYGSRKT